MTKGFHLKKLRITGKDLKNAEVIFTNGLNVISGPSDTGKTYIYQCINYLLGSSQQPKNIPEAKGYSTIYLEIKTFDKKFVTLSRKLSGGGIKKYNCKLDDIKEETNFEELKEKHNSSKVDNISAYLLLISGFSNDKRVKKNKNNKTVSLSFRDIIKFVIANEERILTEQSPILSNNKINNTKEKSVFKLLISGEDDNNIIEKIDQNIQKAQFEAKLEFINDLIERAKQDIEKVETLDNEVEIKQKFNSLTGKLNSVNSAIEEKNDVINQLWSNIQDKKQRKVTLTQLIERFKLLLRQYDADLNRLAFISEGNHYLEQLIDERCPSCNQRLPHEKNCESNFTYDKQISKKQISLACQAEKDKILVSIKDLEGTSKNLIQEHEVISGEISDIQVIYNKEKELLAKELKPKFIEVREELNSLLELQKSYSLQESKKIQIVELESKKIFLEKKIGSKKQNQDKSTDQKVDLNSILKEFLEEVHTLLEDWSFPNLKDIKFDEKEFDLLLSGRLRKDHGKGIRAITYTAFIIAILEYCYKIGLPHPGFVIVDSPLTTYKEKGQNREEEMSDSVHNKFFASLAKSSNQIIVLENKVPPESVISVINYIDFTSKGRQGFFE